MKCFPSEGSFPIVLSLSLATVLSHVQAFSCSWLPPRIGSQRWTTCRSSFSGNDELDSLRSMLEASWDADTMGQVPSDSTIAANEAFSAILSASDKGVRVFFIDLLLPAYDVTQGSNLYDEVLAVEYCMALADCFSGRSSILVRDNKTVETVQRVLDRREESRQPPQSQNMPNDSSDNEEKVAGDDQFNEKDESTNPEKSVEVSDVDFFRQQLMASWENEDADYASPADKAMPTEDQKIDAGTPTPIDPSTEKRYRLASLFGNARISEGSDMMESVVEALRANALPNDDEENLIILSAVKMEEMVAVRSLASKYSSEKKIILVNCKLNPIPRELYGAETVYSILPLIARPSGGDSQATPEDNKPQPRIVVLRRYPGDWQVFVDTGDGFRLAKTAPSDLSNKRGPPMKWIQQAIQTFLHSQ